MVSANVLINQPVETSINLKKNIPIVPSCYTLVNVHITMENHHF